jgi:DNA-3-methyladenine glycosylase I
VEITYAWAMQRAHTEASRALAKDLKRRGWAFVGPTTVYAFMQAMGLVNDHLTGCDARTRVETARSKRPPLEVRSPSTIQA